MEGDIVSIQLNSDGTVASLTILAYGTGTVVGEADEDRQRFLCMRIRQKLQMLLWTLRLQQKQ